MIIPYPKIRQLEMEDQIYDLVDSRVDTLIPTVTSIANVTNEGFKNALIDLLYPVGSVYISMNASAPFDRGTWEQIGKGQALVGVDTESEFEELNTVGNEFGSADTTLPRHNHDESTSLAEWEEDFTGVTISGGKHQHSLGERWSEVDAHGSAHAYTLHYDRKSKTRIHTETNPPDETKNGQHTHTVSADALAPIKKHTHGVDWDGEDPTNTNYPPSITVYIWQRTA